MHLVLNAAERLERIQRTAAEAPSREEVLPVTRRPSGSSTAAAGMPVCSALSSAAETTGRSLHRNAGLVHQQLHLVDGVGVHAPLTVVAQGMVVTADNLGAGGLTDDSSSVMQLPAMLTPMSVGER